MFESWGSYAKELFDIDLCKDLSARHDIKWRDPHNMDAQHKLVIFRSGSSGALVFMK